jgi:hypothetical protein
MQTFFGALTPQNLKKQPQKKSRQFTAYFLSEQYEVLKWNMQNIALKFIV